MPGQQNKSFSAMPVYMADDDLNPVGGATNPLRTTTTAATTVAASTLSGTITASGGTVPIAVTNTTRTEVINPSTATLWASWGTPAVNGAGSFQINAGGSYSPPDRTAGTLTLLSTAAAQPYTVNRFS